MNIIKKQFFLILILFSICAIGQKKGVNTTSPDASAIFEVKSDIGGFLAPRMTQLQRNAIASPAAGLMIYNTTSNFYEIYNGIDWFNLLTHDTNPASKVEAIISSFSYDTVASGMLIVGQAPTGVSQTIKCNVTQAGNYNIKTTTSNGVSFSGSGTFTGTGIQNISLSAVGIPLAVGSFSYVLQNVAFPFSFNLSTTDTHTVIGAGGKIWIAYNLGASSAASTISDFTQYGSLFQWGRDADGHQLMHWFSLSSGATVSNKSSNLSNSDQPGNGLFIISFYGQDWRSPSNNYLWQGVNGINNPCPAGYRLPTIIEFEQEFAAAGISDASSAYLSPLKLIRAGYRNGKTGALEFVGSTGNYWTSTAIGTNANCISFTNTSINTQNSNPRTYGMSVRCIQD